MSHRQTTLGNRIVSTLVILVFTVTSIVWNPAQGYGEPASLNFSNMFQASSQNPADALMSLPPEIGMVKDVYGTDRKVFLIEDAHANPEAQENIRSILRFLNAQYPGLTVAIEGAEGPIHPEYLDLMPGHSEAGDAVVQTLKEEGELNGAELFAWEQYRATENPDGSLSRFVGVENTELYRDNLRTYQEILSRSDEIETLLNPLKVQLEKKSSRVFSSELREFLKERSRHKDGKYSMTQPAQNPNLEAYFAYLKKTALRTLEIDLADPFEQLRFPNLFRFNQLQVIRQDADPAKTAAAWKQFLKEMGTQLKGERNLLEALRYFAAENGFIGEQTNEEFPYSFDRKLFPRKLLEYLFYLKGNRSLDLSKYPQVLESFRNIILRSELDAAGLFTEVAVLEDLLIEKLAVTDAEKELVGELRSLSLLEKTLRLELTRPEYEEIQNRSSNPGPRSSFRDLGTETRDPKIQPVFQAAMQFYRLASKRDQALIENSLALFSGPRATGHDPRSGSSVSQVLVLITGGFHTGAIADLLTEQKIPHAVITPRITRTDRGELYKKTMTGENGDLSAYFKVKNPFPTKQQAVFFKQMLETAVPAVTEKEEIRGAEMASLVQESVSVHPVLSRAVTSELVTGQDQSTIRFTTNPDSRELVPQVSAIPAECLTGFWDYPVSPETPTSALVTFSAGVSVRAEVREDQPVATVPDAISPTEKLNALDAAQLRELFKRLYASNLLSYKSDYQNWNTFDVATVGETERNRKLIASVFILRKIHGVWSLMLGQRAEHSKDNRGSFSIPAGKADHPKNSFYEKDGEVKRHLDSLHISSQVDYSGSILNRESVPAAAIRELHEETGILIGIKDIVGRVDDFRGTRRDVLVNSFIFVDDSESEEIKGGSGELVNFKGIPLAILLDNSLEGVGLAVERYLQGIVPESNLMSGLRNHGGLVGLKKVVETAIKVDETKIDQNLNAMSVVKEDGRAEMREFSSRKDVPGLPPIKDMLSILKQEDAVILEPEAGDWAAALLLKSHQDQDQYVADYKAYDGEFPIDDLWRWEEKIREDNLFGTSVNWDVIQPLYGRDFFTHFNIPAHRGFIAISPELNDELWHRTLLEEFFHDLMGDYGPFVLMFFRYQMEVIDDFLMLMFLPPEQLQNFESSYTQWNPEQMAALQKRYREELGLDPNTQLRSILEALLNDLKNDHVLQAGDSWQTLPGMFPLQVTGWEALSDDLKNNNVLLVDDSGQQLSEILSQSTKTAGKKRNEIDEQMQDYLAGILLQRERFSKYQPLFPNWSAVPQAGVSEKLSQLQGPATISPADKRSELRKEVKARGVGDMASETMGRVAFYNQYLTEEILFPPYDPTALNFRTANEIQQEFENFTSELKISLKQWQEREGRQLPQQIFEAIEKIKHEVDDHWGEIVYTFDRRNSASEFAQKELAQKGMVPNPIGSFLRGIQDQREKHKYTIEDGNVLVDMARRTALTSGKGPLNEEDADEELRIAEEVLDLYRDTVLSQKEYREQKLTVSEAVKELMEQEKVSGQGEERARASLSAIQKAKKQADAEDIIQNMWRTYQEAIYLNLLGIKIDKEDGSKIPDLGVRRRIKERMLREHRSFRHILYEEVMINGLPGDDDIRGVPPLFKARRNLRGLHMETAMSDVISFFDDMLASIQSRSGTSVVTHEIKAEGTDDGIILVVRDFLGASKVRDIWRRYGHRIKAVVTDKANLTTHWVVVLQGMSNPPPIMIVTPGEAGKLSQLTQDDKLLLSINSNKEAFLFINPSEERIGSSLQRNAGRMGLRRAKIRQIGMPTGGISVRANVVPEMVEDPLLAGADGVGLTRTEVDEKAEALMVQMAIAMAKGDKAGMENAAELLQAHCENVYLLKAEHPSLRRKVNTERLFDIWPDKDEVLFQQMKHWRLIDDNEKASGFLFYRTPLGAEVLKRQFAAFLAAEVKIREDLKDNKPEAQWLVPHVSTTDDLAYIFEKIIPAARERALKKLQNKGMDAAEAVQRVNEAFKDVKIGIMVETPEAVQNLNDLLEYSYQGRGVEFLNIGMNDLEIRLLQQNWNKKIRGKRMALNRDDPWVQPYLGRLDPIYVEAYNEIMGKVAKKAIEDGKSPLPICFCGQIAAEPRFLYLIRYFKKTYGTQMLNGKNVQLALSLSASVSPVRVSDVKFDLRLDGEEAVFKLFDKFFSGSLAVPDLDQEVNQLVSSIVSRSEKILMFDEEYQENFERLGRLDPVYRIPRDVVNDPGSYWTWDFIARLLESLEGIHIARNPNKEIEINGKKFTSISEEGFDQMLERLQEMGLAAKEETDKLKESFRFLENVRNTYLRLRKEDPNGLFAGSLHPELVPQFIKEMGTGPGTEWKEGIAEKDLPWQLFRFDSRYRERVDSLVRAVRSHYIGEAIPSITEEEKPVDRDWNNGKLKFTKRQVTGPAITEPVKRVYGTYKYLSLEDAADVLAKDPAVVLDIFKMLIGVQKENGSMNGPIRLDEETRRTVRLNRKVLYDAKENPSVKEKIRSFLTWLLKEDADLSYAMTRMNRLRLVSIVLKGFTDILYQIDLSRPDLPLHALTVNAFMALERLAHADSFVLEQAKNVFLNLRAQPEKIEILRLAILFQNMLKFKLVEQRAKWEKEGIAPSQKDILDWFESEVGKLLELNRIDPSAAKQIAWLLYTQERTSGRDLVYVEEMTELVRESVLGLQDFSETSGISSEDSKDLFGMLYLLQFISRYSSAVAPEKAELLEYGGFNAPLANWDKFYLIGLSALAGELPTDVNELTSILQNMHFALMRGETIPVGGYERFIDFSSLAGLGSRMPAPDFYSVLTQYIRHTNFTARCELCDKPANEIRRDFFKPDSFYELLTAYRKGVSVYRAKTLSDKEIVLEMLMLKHLEAVQGQPNSEEVVTTAFVPLSDKPAAGPVPFRILFGTPRNDSELETIYSRVLKERGFNIGTMDRYRFELKGKTKKVAFVEAVGHFIPRDDASIDQTLAGIRRDLEFIFKHPTWRATYKDFQKRWPNFMGGLKDLSVSRGETESMKIRAIRFFRMDHYFGPLIVEKPVQFRDEQVTCTWKNTVLEVVAANRLGLYAFIRAYLEMHMGLIIKASSSCDDVHENATRTPLSIIDPMNGPLSEEIKEKIVEGLEKSLAWNGVMMEDVGRVVRPIPNGSGKGQETSKVSSASSEQPAQTGENVPDVSGQPVASQDVSAGVADLQFKTLPGDIWEAQKEYTIGNFMGIHGRAASKIVSIPGLDHIKDFLITVPKQDVKDENGNIKKKIEKEEQISGKAMLDLLTLGALRGTAVAVTMRGADREQIEEVFKHLEALDDYEASEKPKGTDLIFKPGNSRSEIRSRTFQDVSRISVSGPSALAAVAARSSVLSKRSETRAKDVDTVYQAFKDLPNKIVQILEEKGMDEGKKQFGYEGNRSPEFGNATLEIVAKDILVQSIHNYLRGNPVSEPVNMVLAALPQNVDFLLGVSANFTIQIKEFDKNRILSGLLTSGFPVSGKLENGKLVVPTVMLGVPVLLKLDPAQFKDVKNTAVPTLNVTELVRNVEMLESFLTFSIIEFNLIQSALLPILENNPTRSEARSPRAEEILTAIQEEPETYSSFITEAILQLKGAVVEEVLQGVLDILERPQGEISDLVRQTASRPIWRLIKQNPFLAKDNKGYFERILQLLLDDDPQVRNEILMGIPHMMKAAPDSLANDEIGQKIMIKIMEGQSRTPPLTYSRDVNESIVMFSKIIDQAAQSRAEMRQSQEDRDADTNSVSVAIHQLENEIIQTLKEKGIEEGKKQFAYKGTRSPEFGNATLEIVAKDILYRSLISYRPGRPITEPLATFLSTRKDLPEDPAKLRSIFLQLAGDLRVQIRNFDKDRIMKGLRNKTDRILGEQENGKFLVKTVILEVPVSLQLNPAQLEAKTITAIPEVTIWESVGDAGSQQFSLFFTNDEFEEIKSIFKPLLENKQTRSEVRSQKDRDAIDALLKSPIDADDAILKKFKTVKFPKWATKIPSMRPAYNDYKNLQSVLRRMREEVLKIGSVHEDDIENASALVSRLSAFCKNHNRTHQKEKFAESGFINPLEKLQNNIKDWQKAKQAQQDALKTLGDRKFYRPETVMSWPETEEYLKEAGAVWRIDVAELVAPYRDAVRAKDRKNRYDIMHDDILPAVEKWLTDPRSLPAQKEAKWALGFFEKWHNYKRVDEELLQDAYEKNHDGSRAGDSLGPRFRREIFLLWEQLDFMIKMVEQLPPPQQMEINFGEFERSEIREDLEKTELPELSKPVGLKVLVADDDGSARGMYELILSTIGGVEIVKAESGEEALEKFKRDPDSFDLIFTDFTMPGMNGAEFLSKALNIRQVPAVVLSADSPNDVQAAIEKNGNVKAGIEVLSKPLDGRVIKSIIEETRRSEIRDDSDNMISALPEIERPLDMSTEKAAEVKKIFILGHQQSGHVQLRYDVKHYGMLVPLLLTKFPNTKVDMAVDYANLFSAKRFGGRVAIARDLAYTVRTEPQEPVKTIDVPPGAIANAVNQNDSSILLNWLIDNGYDLVFDFTNSGLNFIKPIAQIAEQNVSTRFFVNMSPLPKTDPENVKRPPSVLMIDMNKPSGERRRRVKGTGVIPGEKHVLWKTREGQAPKYWEMILRTYRELGLWKDKLDLQTIDLEIWGLDELEKDWVRPLLERKLRQNNFPDENVSGAETEKDVETVQSIMNGKQKFVYVNIFSGQSPELGDADLWARMLSTVLMETNAILFFSPGGPEDYPEHAKLDALMERLRIAYPTMAKRMIRMAGDLSVNLVGKLMRAMDLVVTVDHSGFSDIATVLNVPQIEVSFKENSPTATFRYNSKVLAKNSIKNGDTIVEKLSELKKTAREQVLQSPVPTGFRVLVAEDEPVSRILLEKFLRSSGFIAKVVANKNGAEALKEFAENPDSYDAVFTDVNMPEMGGIELMDELFKIKKVPVVVISSDNFEKVENVIRKHQEAGRDVEFYSKPFDREVIQAIAKKTYEKLHPDTKSEPNETQGARPELRGSTQKVKETLLKVAKRGGFKIVNNWVRSELQIPIAEAAETVGSFSREGIAVLMPGRVNNANLDKARLWVAGQLTEKLLAGLEKQNIRDPKLEEHIQMILAIAPKTIEVPSSQFEPIKTVHVDTRFLSKEEWKTLFRYLPFADATLFALREQLILDFDKDHVTFKELSDMADTEGISLDDSRIILNGVTGKKFAPAQVDAVLGQTKESVTRVPFHPTEGPQHWYFFDREEEARTSLEVIFQNIEAILWAVRDISVSRTDVKKASQYSSGALLQAVFSAMQAYLQIRAAA